jgi:hypothetical protein
VLVHVAATRILEGGAGDLLDVRHEEFMAMADTFLGPCFDREKLARVESLQRELHGTQAGLGDALDAHKIDANFYVDEVNRLHFSIARQCEKILGPSDFFKLFGVRPAEMSEHIDKDVFFAHT